MSGPEFDTVHMSVPGPDGPVCDFCSSPEVCWSFPCRDHAEKPEHAEAIRLRRDGSLDVQSTVIHGFSSGDWAACEVCKRLIDSGARDRLASRSAKRLIRKHPDMGLVLSNLTDHIRRLQDQFWANREGEPTPYPEPTEGK